MKGTAMGFVTRLTSGLVRTIAAVFLTFLGFVALVLALTFFFGDEYVPGHVPSLVLSTYPHYWVMTVVMLIIVCIVWVILRRTTLSKVVLTMAIVALAVSGVGIYQMVKALNEAGGNVDFFAVFSPWDVTPVSTDDFEYMQGKSGPLSLTVYHYDEDGKTDKPVIFYTHGGGWVSGNRFERDFDCKVLALLGYVVVSWDYDLSDWETHLWDTVEPEAVQALTWVRDNIGAFGASTDRFYMIGDSAGGQITLDVAYKLNGGFDTGADGNPLPEIDAICCNYPVASPTAFWEYHGTLINTDGASMVERYIGGTPAEHDMRAAAIEPSNFITSSAPPTFIMVPGADSLVPGQASYDLAEKLTANGIENSVVTVPHANHGFDISVGSIGDQGYVTFIVHWIEAHQ